MKLISRCLLPLLLLLTVSCSSGPLSSTFPLRNGPEFKEAFPDVSLLVTTDDIRDAREVLSTAVLPETEEHHAMLMQLLEETQELDSGHLILLTEAVALDHPAEGRTVFYSSGGSHTTYWSRGEGKYAHVVDDLLLAGVSKLRDPSPEHFGQLLSKTQSKEGLVEFANRCASMSNAKDWDDGSTSDLEEILEGTMVDQVALELCIEVLLPNDRLNEARADVAVRSLSFDSGRSELLAADYGRRKSLSADRLLDHVNLMSFDSGRIATIKAGAPILSRLNGLQTLDLVETASFDSGRIEIVQLLADRVEFRSAPDVLSIIETASFDSGRTKILNTLTEGSFVKLNGEDLIAFVELASFDSGRLELLTMLQPHVGMRLSTDDLQALIETSSFDSGRKQVAELFITDLRRVPRSERNNILDCFSFDSAKSDVRDMLDW